jgi:hypothetical protein
MVAVFGDDSLVVLDGPLSQRGCGASVGGGRRAA